MRQLLSAVAIATLAACTTSNPDVVRRYETQRLSQVYDATVLSVRPVTVEGNQSGIGAGAGAVAGGVAGTAIDQNSTRRGIAVTVQKDSGQQVTIAQNDDGDVQMGDRVAIVYDSNGTPRVVRDTGYRRD